MAETFTERTRPYRAVLASRMRSQRSYRFNFRADLVSSLLVGLVELAEVWVLFHAVGTLGGFTFAQILLVYGIADFCFSLADMFVGHVDNLPTYLRAGTLDVFYLRPQPVLLQLITSDIALKRLARGGVAVVCIVAGVMVNDIDWSPAHVLVFIAALLCGTTIFAAQFVIAGGLQFFLINGAEATNSFVYGGRYASTQVASVWNRPIKVIFGFVFPMAFVGFVPTTWILDKTGPEWLPAWLVWLLPVAALWSCLAAAISWRVGMRHYQGGGG